jgi:hypothetical protein
MAKDGKFSVTLAADDDKLLEDLMVAYQGMGKGTIARILLHYALPRAAEAMGLPAGEVLANRRGVSDGQPSDPSDPSESPTSGDDRPRP